ncbi:hypothetical protein J4Q44_G00261120 [Coregonus suidteri]|uniref:Uncharacterized protein n=1 Tax=Coregonus suidteri TaxID=861788 RepID=A0AAN8L3X7_9TELE
MQEYGKTKSLTDATRRQMINILAAEMTETHGTSPPKSVRVMYAQGIVALFPYLEDPYSQHGYDHYYDPESGSGYLAWRLKTIRKTAEERGASVSKSPKVGGPGRDRQPFTYDREPSDEDVEAAIAVLRHSADENTVREKMKMTFIYRQAMVNDEAKSSDVFSVFPRFLDTPGLVGTSVQQHLDNITQSSQPYLLAQGSTQSSIHSYFIVVDKHALPCKATGSVGAFDEVFKAHYVFDDIRPQHDQEEEEAFRAGRRLWRQMGEDTEQVEAKEVEPDVQSDDLDGLNFFNQKKKKPKKVFDNDIEEWIKESRTRQWKTTTWNLQFTKVDFHEEGEILEKDDSLQDDEGENNDGISFSSQSGPAWLLNHVINIMREKNPNMVADEKRKFVMKPPQVV